MFAAAAGRQQKKAAEIIAAAAAPLVAEVDVPTANSADGVGVPGGTGPGPALPSLSADDPSCAGILPRAREPAGSTAGPSAGGEAAAESGAPVGLGPSGGEAAEEDPPPGGCRCPGNGQQVPGMLWLRISSVAR